MAFINCSKCGKRVSDKTQTCIHCGASVVLTGTKNETSTYTETEKNDTDTAIKDRNKEHSSNRKIRYKKRKCDYCGGYSTADETHCLCCGARYEEFAVEEDVKKKESPKANEQETMTQQNNTSNQTAKPQNYTTYSVQYQATPKVKSKWIAFLLCLFLGVFGAHKFYEGKMGMGILYLFTMGLFGFGWMYDCIVYLLKKGNTYEVK